MARGDEVGDRLPTATRTQRRRDLRFLVAVALLFGTAVLASVYDDSIPPLAAAARIAFFVTIATLFLQTGLALRAEKELERIVVLEAAAIALVAVLLAALVSAALNEFDVIGPATPWVFWNVGTLVWVVSKVVLTRRRT